MTPEIRIGSGQFKGQRISSRGAGYRPTSGIVKKSLFDILADDLDESRFLDLFAGSGAVGVEALSRGAKYVCFVECNASRVNVIKKNIEKMGIAKEFVEVLQMDYALALELLRKRKASFDLIYVDPPYGELEPARILGDIATSRVLSEDGAVIFESTKRDVRKIIESIPESLYPFRERALGSTALIFLRWRGDHSGANIES